jgi:Fic family protein
MDRLRNSPIGRLVPIEDKHVAYVPDPLPTSVPLDESLSFLLDEASRAVATLAGAGETLPNPHLLIRPFARREAVLSSRIEGTQASLSDVYLFEASGVEAERGDAREVANYVRALERGLEMLEQLPLCVRLTNEVHMVLLEGVRGEDKRPGQLRDRTVWIGSRDTLIEESRYVPPPAPLLADLMAGWEHFVNQQPLMPPLVQCALMHYQFEAIHPYLDGNGRIGRLLITLFLKAKGVLTTPLLYLSAYFEQRRQEYYDGLHRVSETGEWHPWIGFFLAGVKEQSRDALIRSRRVRELQENFRVILRQERMSGNASRLLEELFIRPVTTTPIASAVLGMTSAGTRKILERFAEMGILQRLDSWPVIYVARDLLDAVDKPV